MKFIPYLQILLNVELFSCQHWAGSEMTLWRMRTAFWIPKATNTHSQYIILISFLRQQWLTNEPQYYFVLTLPVLVDYI